MTTTTAKLDPARIIAASLDSEPAFSAEGIMQKFLVRWKLFVACTLIVPVVALAVAALIPTTYKSTAQVLIRAEGGASGLYTGITPLRVALTGASSAEVIKSTAVASQMIEEVGVQSADIYRPAYKVLLGKAMALILPLLGREPEDRLLAANPRLKYTYLADDLKPSIDATTLMMDHSTSTQRDEMVNVTLKATNREKVAAMVNGLCDDFIRLYNQRSRDEILVAKKTLDDQVAEEEAQIVHLHATPAEDIAPPEILPSDANTNPLTEGLGHSVSDLETQLAVLRETYSENAPEVVQAESELKHDRALLAQEEAIDQAGERLSQLKVRLGELRMAAMLCETGQGDVSVVEHGLTPKKTKVTLLIKYGIPGGGGLVGGMLIGAIAILMLNALDPRLLVADDVPVASKLSLLGVIPASGMGTVSGAQLNELPVADARPTLLQALGRLDIRDRKDCRVILVTSAENESSSAQVALQLAALMARDRDNRVLLIDANFDHPALTEGAAAKSEPGLLDVLAGAAAGETVRPTKLVRLSFLGIGHADLRDEISSSRDSWARLLDQSRKNYGTILIHAGGLLNSREVAPLAKDADQSLLVTNLHATRKDRLAQAAALLADIGAPVLGVIHCERKS
ncbi:MAG TPA: Wzz/FepE/Etk N-terminal domain-containing protein [Opitutaceae bacterium]|nr:Wzz/FepE/Etk N-terminal domain-containing protein [Opitutaceae bacterium]